MHTAKHVAMSLALDLHGQQLQNVVAGIGGSAEQAYKWWSARNKARGLEKEQQRSVHGSIATQSVTDLDSALNPGNVHAQPLSVDEFARVERALLELVELRNLQFQARNDLIKREEHLRQAEVQYVLNPDQRPLLREKLQDAISAHEQTVAKVTRLTGDIKDYIKLLQELDP